MEWKELQIDNLLPDILTGDYEFKGKQPDERWVEPFYREEYTEQQKRALILTNICNPSRWEYRYRKPEPKAPSHLELAQRYIKQQNIFDIHNETIQIRGAIENLSDTVSDELRKAFIAGRESADIPPEV